MLVYDKDFRQNNLRFLRQVFFEKRVIYLEHQMGAAYMNNPTMPGWTASVPAVMDQVLYLDAQNDRPIKLIVDSSGGATAAFLNLIDVMSTARSPIYTIGRGLVASAAVPILAAGALGHRLMFPNATTMLHMMWGQIQGNADEIRSQTKELVRIEGLYVSTLSRLTGRTEEEIKAAMNAGETYMAAEQSIAFGLADKIVTSLQEVLVL